MDIDGLKDDVEVINPKFEITTELNLVGFEPDSEEIFKAYPNENRYVWHFDNLVVKKPERCVVWFWDENNSHSAKPRFNASRSVEPEILTEKETLQTVKLSFKLEEALPEGINGFGIHIGSIIIAHEGVQLVQGEIIDQVAVEGWNMYSDGVAAEWHIHPQDITIGKTYVFEATLLAQKSDDLKGSPLFKPLVGVHYGEFYRFDHEPVYTDTVVIEVLGGRTIATISADNSLNWVRSVSPIAYDFWFSEIISQIAVPPEGPPYYVLIPASVDIHPKTLKLSSCGVFTAYVQLPSPYSVHDIDISTVVCEGAEAIRGSIEDEILNLQFRRQDLCEVESGEEVEFIIIGELSDGSIFEAKDYIRVLE